MNFKKTAIFASLTSVLAAIAFTVTAQQAMDSEPAKEPANIPRFEELDSNVDGVITIDEANDSWLVNNFQKVDVNQDGYISKTEYTKIRG